MRNGVLIYFTDGLGEAELTANPMNIRVLWVLTGRGEKLSLVNPYGKILRISNSKPVERDNKNEFMKNELKDTLIEWAK